MIAVTTSTPVTTRGESAHR